MENTSTPEHDLKTKLNDALSQALNDNQFDVVRTLLDNTQANDKQYDTEYLLGTIQGDEKKEEVRTFLEDYWEDRYYAAQANSIRDVTDSLKSVEEEFSPTHTDIKHFHSHFIKYGENGNDINDREGDFFHSYGKNKETGIVEYLDRSSIRIGEFHDTTLGASLEQRNVYSFTNQRGENNEEPLGLEYMDVIRSLHVESQHTRIENEYDRLDFNVLRFATEEIRGDVRFVQELMENCPEFIYPSDFSESLQTAIGANDPKEYLDKKLEVMDLEHKLNTLYGSLDHLDDQEPVQKLGRETPTQSQPANATATNSDADTDTDTDDWDSARVKSMEQARARMKAGRERSMGIKNKI